MALATSAPIGLFVATERDGVVLVNDCFEAVSYTHLTLPTTPYV